MRYPFEQQNDLKDCGVSCLSMIIRYYGGGVSKEYLRNLTHTTKDGVSAYSLIEGAKQLGFSAMGVSGEIRNLKNENLPCIAHVVIKKSYQHFVVVYKIYPKTNKILVADPAKKKLIKYDLSDFNKISTNKFIFLKPNKKIDYIKKNTVLKDMIRSVIINNIKLIVFFSFFSLISAFLNIINSFQFKFMMEYVISYHNLNNLVFLTFLFLGIVLGKEFSNYYRNRLVNVFNLKLDKTLFSNIYHHILSLPYLYYKNRMTGEIVARINDLESIRSVISKIIITVLLDSILMIASFFTLFWLSNKLTLVLVIIVLLFIILISIFQKVLEDKIMKSKVEGAKLNSFLVETIGGIETIQNCDIQDYIEKNFSLFYGSYHKNTHSYNKVFLLEQFLKNTIQECGMLVIMIVGCYMVMEKELEISSFITYITLINYFLNPIEGFIDLHLSFKDAKTSFNRIHELYEFNSYKKDNSLRKINDSFQNLSTKHLKYSYNGIKFLLKNINININKRDKVLIYGESGSGKSTLAKILSKHLQVENKMFFFNSKDINYYTDCDIKKKICYISQQETLFTDSVYQNIILDKDIDYSKFLEVCKLCMVDEFVSQNILNYDMLLEENGFNLSGGQRQRIILARSLLKEEADIYILDEALNEVDIKKERKILEAIFSYYPDKTFMVISHRFHNNDLFNKKYLIDKGISYEK